MKQRRTCRSRADAFGKIETRGCRLDRGGAGSERLIISVSIPGFRTTYSGRVTDRYYRPTMIYTTYQL